MDSIILTRDRAVRLARLAHNHEVAGSNPAPATSFAGNGSLTENGLVAGQERRMRKGAPLFASGTPPADRVPTVSVREAQRRKGTEINPESEKRPGADVPPGRFHFHPITVPTGHRVRS